MTDPQTHAPLRLLEDPALDAGLRLDLELAAAQAPVVYDAGAGLARFESALTAGASTLPPGGTGLGLRALGWFIGASVLVAGGVGAAHIVRAAHASDAPIVVQTPARIHDRSHDRSRNTSRNTSQDPLRGEGDTVAGPSPSDAEPAPLDAGLGGSAVEAPVGDEAGDASAASARAGGNSPALGTSAPPRPNSNVPGEPSNERSPAPAGSLADEAKQINAARKALSADPARTLALVEAAAKDFPNGALVQEREGYAVLALAALGRQEQAQARAQRYLEHWPNGTLARRVRAETKL